MNNKTIYDYMSQYGGKHGGILYFQEKYPELDLVVPTEVRPLSQGFTQLELEEILIKGPNSKHIVRTSCPGDRDGLVDMMPSPIIEGAKHWDLHQINIIEALNNPNLQEAVDYMNQQYEKDKVTISVAPYFEGDKYIVTEHPNIEGRYFIDYDDRGGSFDSSIISWYQGEEFYPRFSLKSNIADRLIDLVQMIKTNCNIIGTEKLQYEIGYNAKYNSLKMFQIRKFTSQYNDRKIEKLQFKNREARIMGGYPANPKSLDHVENYYGFRHSGYGNYVLTLKDDGNLSDFSLKDVVGNDIKGFIVGYSPYRNHGLFHNTTRFAQKTLNNGGFVVMDLYDIDKFR